MVHVVTIGMAQRNLLVSLESVVSEEVAVATEVADDAVLSIRILLNDAFVVAVVFIDMTEHEADGSSLSFGVINCVGGDCGA